MKKYEAMFMIKPDLSGDEKKNLLGQINDSVTKNNGTILEANIWAEKRKLCYSVKKYQEGTYYLVNFNILPDAISKIKQSYRLNENILRVLVTKADEKPG